MSRLRSALIVLAVVWAVMVPMASFAASRSTSLFSSAGFAFALVVYRIGSLICHQRPERSFSLFGAQLPVCARCTGIYAGAALMAIIGSLRTRFAAPRPNPVGSAVPPTARRVLLIACLPTAATLLYEWTTGQTPGPWMRAASGALIGVAVAWIVCGVEPADWKVM
jgi:hypothetical protein